MGLPVRRTGWIHHIVHFLLGALLFLWAAQGSAQTLSERPTGKGGNPVGIWEADRTPIQAYAPPQLLQVLTSLTFGGSVSGRLTLEAGGGFQADYILPVSVSLSLLGAPIQVDIADTNRQGGTYRVEETRLILEQNTTPVIRDTMEFTVEGDTLKLIQRVPLGTYASLAAAFIPADDPPLAVLLMYKVGEPGGEPEALTADFDGNGEVSFADFLLFVRHFGARSGETGYDSTYDLNGNGEVGFTDFLEFASQFGKKG